MILSAVRYALTPAGHAFATKTRGPDDWDDWAIFPGEWIRLAVLTVMHRAGRSLDASEILSALGGYVDPMGTPMARTTWCDWYKDEAPQRLPLAMRMYIDQGLVTIASL